MIWIIILVSLTACWAGWKVARKSNKRWIFGVVAMATAGLVTGLVLSHYNVADAIWFKRALGLYCLCYLLLWSTTIIWALFWKWRWARITLSVVLLANIVYGYITSRCIRVESFEIQSDRLPQAFDNFRIVLFSDVHLGSMPCPKAMVRQLVEKINELDADIIVQCGDIITYRAEEFDDEIMAILGELKAKYGIWSVLGNHDMGLYHTRDTAAWHREEALLIEKELSMGWCLLDNETDYVVIDSDSLAITGLAYPDELIHRSHHTLKNAIDYRQYYSDTKRFNITLSHAPQTWEVLLEQGIETDLTLSGHVHSMQMNILGWTPASLLYKRSSGLYNEYGRRLYINDGIGTIMAPMRIGAHPEITLITLHR